MPVVFVLARYETNLSIYPYYHVYVYMSNRDRKLYVNSPRMLGGGASLLFSVGYPRAFVFEPVYSHARCKQLRVALAVELPVPRLSAKASSTQKCSK